MEGTPSTFRSPAGWRLHLRFLGMPWLLMSSGVIGFLIVAFFVCRMAEFPFWMGSWWFAVVVTIVGGLAAMLLSPGSDAELSDFGGQGARSGDRRDFERARQRARRTDPISPSSANTGDIRLFDFLHGLIHGSCVSMAGLGFAITWVCLALVIFIDQVLNSSAVGGPYDPNSSGIVPTTLGWGLLVTLLFAGIFPLITMVPLRALLGSVTGSVSLWTLWRRAVPHGTQSYSLLNCLDPKGSIHLDVLESAYRKTSREGRTLIASVLAEHQQIAERRKHHADQSAACLERLIRIETEEGNQEMAGSLGGRAFESALRKSLTAGKRSGTAPVVRDYVADESVIVSLDLSGTEFRADDIAHLPNKAGLRELNLSGANLAMLKPDAFSEFRSLEKLDVSHASISAEGATGLGSLKQLRELNLAGRWPYNELATNRFLQSLSKLSNLESLNLNQGTGSTPAFSDEAVSRFLAMRSLKRLDLEGSDLTDEGYRKLIRGLDLTFIGFTISTGNGGGKSLSDTGADKVGLTLNTIKAIKQERPGLTTRFGAPGSIGSDETGAGFSFLVVFGLFFLLPAIISEVGSIAAKKQLILELAESLSEADSRPEKRGAKGSLSNFQKTREKRIEELAGFGHQAIAAAPVLRETMIRAWDEDDRRTYRKTVEALGRIDAHGSAEFFVEQFVGRCLADEDDDTLVRGLKKWVAHLAIPGLEKALDHQSQEVRSNAVQLIGEIGGPTVSVPALLKLAEDGTKEDRAGVVDALKQLVNRESGRYRRNAEQALEKLTR